MPEVWHPAEGHGPAVAPGEEDVPTGEPLTEQDKEDVEWARQAVKEEVTTLNDTLRHLVTLSAALLGLSVAFFDKTTVPGWSKGAWCLFLLAALAASLWGSAPMISQGYLYLERVRAIREAMAQRKVRCFQVAGVSLLLALSAFLLGLGYTLGR
jgi:hypothetical protein